MIKANRDYDESPMPKDEKPYRIQVAELKAGVRQLRAAIRRENARVRKIQKLIALQNHLVETLTSMRGMSDNDILQRETYRPLPKK